MADKIIYLIIGVFAGAIFGFFIAALFSANSGGYTDEQAMSDNGESHLP